MERFTEINVQTTATKTTCACLETKSPQTQEIVLEIPGFYYLEMLCIKI